MIDGVKLCHTHIPVYSSLLQVGLIVTMFAVFTDQFVGVRLMWCVLCHQGNANAQGATIVVYLQQECCFKLCKIHFNNVF